MVINMKKILIIMLCLIPLVFLASCNDSEIESTETLVKTGDSGEETREGDKGGFLISFFVC